MAREAAINPYANLRLRKQIYLEARSMAEFALSKGVKIPLASINAIESYEQEFELEEQGKGVELTARQPLDALLLAHESLTTLVAPATPKTILLLDIEQGRHHMLKFLGPVGLVRQMMLMAIISLLLFIIFPLVLNVSNAAEQIATSSGMPSLPNLLFYLVSAGLGASFASLYMANGFITKGTFDPTYQASYWIRFLLGLIAGLVLAVVVSQETLKGTEFIEEGIIRPLLAILGGFSADLVYTLLNRLVETLKSLFQGSMQQLIDTKTEAARVQAEGQVAGSRMRLAAELMRLQQELGAESDPEAVQKRLNELMGELMQSGR